MPKTPSSREHRSGAAGDLELRFKVLSIEYSHLTSMLTSTWSITAARTNLFFVAVSASGVALALLANASTTGAIFPLLALGVLLLILFTGVVAQARLLRANRETVSLRQALNRIRHFFVEIDPGVQHYIGPAATDDDIALFGRDVRWSSIGALTQAPAASMASLVGLINAFVTAAIAGLVYLLASGSSQVNAVIAAAIALAIAIVAFEGWALADVQQLRQSLDVRFPTLRGRPDDV